MAELAVGIDLGTSNSCVAIARGTEVEVLPNAYGERISASVVAFHEDGTITVGNAAKANIIHDPMNTVYSAKRLIGRYFFSEEVKKAQAICAYEIVEGPNHGVHIRVREEEFSLPEVSAMVLREMKSIAEARLGEPVTRAVITVPAYFNDNQRQATKDAGRIAGLEVLRILNEPTAAAVAYGFGKGLNQKVAVYDLGGGTFDISVLEIGRDVFEVLATAGDTFLGGDDFDDRLIDLLADEFLAQQNINLRNDPYALEKLKAAAEAAKKGLSVDERVEIRLPDVIDAPDGQPRTLERTLDRQEYTSLVMDLVQRTFKVCDEAMQQANLTVRDLDGVILVGGPTRLPVIREAVQAYFQRDLMADVDPDEVVAKGAAIHAASLVGDSSGETAYLLDVTPLDLCIGVAGGLAEPVIEKNTPVPIEQSRSFTTFKDDQESVQIRVYQGQSRDVEENELLGQFEFSGFKKARRGEVQIDVTFEINADGIVNVTARDPESGAEAKTKITLSSGLSETELQTIVAEGRTDRVVSEGAPARAAGAAPRSGAGAAPRSGAGGGAGGAPPARGRPRPAPAEEDDLALEVLDGDEDLELLGEEEMQAGSAGSGPVTEPLLDDAPPARGEDPRAITADDLDGAPGDEVPLDRRPVELTRPTADEQPDADASPEDRDALFDRSKRDLSGGGDGRE